MPQIHKVFSLLWLLLAFWTVGCATKVHPPLPDMTLNPHGETAQKKKLTLNIITVSRENPTQKIGEVKFKVILKENNEGVGEGEIGSGGTLRIGGFEKNRKYQLNFEDTPTIPQQIHDLIPIPDQTDYTFALRERFTLTVWVVDSQSASPVKSASVELLNSKQQTIVQNFYSTQEGQFTYTGTIPQGTYYLKASAPGHLENDQLEEISDLGVGMKIERTIKLTKIDDRFGEKIEPPGSEAPPSGPGTVVTLTHEGGRMAQGAVIDEHGNSIDCVIIILKAEIPLIEGGAIDLSAIYEKKLDHQNNGKFTFRGNLPGDHPSVKCWLEVSADGYQPQRYPPEGGYSVERGNTWEDIVITLKKQ